MARKPASFADFFDAHPRRKPNRLVNAITITAIEHGKEPAYSLNIVHASSIAVTKHLPCRKHGRRMARICCGHEPRQRFFGLLLRVKRLTQQRAGLRNAAPRRETEPSPEFTAITLYTLAVIKVNSQVVRSVAVTHLRAREKQSICGLRVFLDANAMEQHIAEATLSLGNSGIRRLSEKLNRPIRIRLVTKQNASE